MRPSIRIFTSALMLGALAACAADTTEEMEGAADDQPAVSAEETDAPAADEMVDAADAVAMKALVDLNEAPAAALQAVEGLGGEAVAALTSGQPFENMLAVDALLAEQGMDETQREELYRRVWIPIDLNNASEEEILLIPGVGDRMAHEFDEYRPYEGMERFRAEIGKYVDEAEVARLERYVEIR